MEICAGSIGLPPDLLTMLTVLRLVPGNAKVSRIEGFKEWQINAGWWS